MIADGEGAEILALEIDIEQASQFTSFRELLLGEMPALLTRMSIGERRERRVRPRRDLRSFETSTTSGADLTACALSRQRVIDGAACVAASTRRPPWKSAGSLPRRSRFGASADAVVLKALSSPFSFVIASLVPR